MLTRSAAAVALSLVVALFPGFAHADDRSERRQTARTSGGGVDAILEKQPAQSRQQPRADAPSAARGAAGAAEQVARSVTDVLAGLCSAAAGVGGESVCRATEDQEAWYGATTIRQPVDADAAAQRVARRLELATPTLQTSPQDPVQALVGLQTWLWVPDGEWRTLRVSAELDGVRLTVAAEPVETRWDMGESVTVCDNPGRPWRKGLGQEAKTPCGYTYQKTSAREPEKKYDISALIRYRITWACDGDDCDEDSGDLGTLDSPPGTATLQVGERHAVIVN